MPYDPRAEPALRRTAPSARARRGAALRAHRSARPRRQLPRSCYPIVEVRTARAATPTASSTTERPAGSRRRDSRHQHRPAAARPARRRQVFDVDMESFNYLNPSAARSVFRQSAIDTFLLTRFVRRARCQLPASVSPERRRQSASTLRSASSATRRAASRAVSPRRSSGASAPSCSRARAGGSPSPSWSAPTSPTSRTW